MNREKISVVITDLDNTLFDWVNQWYHSFDSMIDKIVEIGNFDKELILKEAKIIHQKYGTSEYSHIIEELPSLKAKDPDKNLVELYRTAIVAYQKSRKQYLKLYPSVFQSQDDISKVIIKNKLIFGRMLDTI